MATTTVSAGQTFALIGTLDSASSLIALSGNETQARGAQIRTTGVVTNNGTIGLLAGPVGEYYPYLRQVSGATLANSGTLGNTGLIDIHGGTPGYFASFDVTVTGAVMRNTGSLTNSGTVIVGAAASYVYSGVSYAIYPRYGTGGQLRDAGSFTNSAMLQIQGAQLGAGSQGGGTVMVSGVLTNSGTIDVAGARTVYETAKGGRLDASGGLLTITGTGSVTNTGAITLHGGYPGSHHGNVQGAMLSDSGVLTNSGSIAVQGGYAGDPVYGAGATVTVQTGGVLNNTGGISLLGGNVFDPYGYTEGRPGQLLVYGSLNNNAGGTITVGHANALYFGFGDPARLLVDGVMTNAGALVIQGGSAGGFEYSSPLPGGTVDISGTLTNTGRITLAGTPSPLLPGSGGVIHDDGQLINSGTIVVGGVTLDAGAYIAGAPTTLLVNGTLTNSRMIEVQAGVLNGPSSAGYQAAGGQLVDRGSISNSGTLTLDSNTTGGLAGTVTVFGTLTDTGTIGGGGTLTNKGTVLSGSATTGAIKVGGFYNDGTVKVAAAAALTVTNPVVSDAGSSGIFTLAANSRLTLGKFVSASEKITFAGSGATLLLGVTSSFHGVLDQLAPTDKLDFQSLIVNSATATGTTLKLTTASSGVINLTLSAPLPASDHLLLSSDGAGGTILTVSATAASGFAEPILASHELWTP